MTDTGARARTDDRTSEETGLSRGNKLQRKRKSERETTTTANKWQKEVKGQQDKGAGKWGGGKWGKGKDAKGKGKGYGKGAK